MPTIKHAYTTVIALISEFYNIGNADIDLRLSTLGLYCFTGCINYIKVDVIDVIAILLHHALNYKIHLIVRC